MHSTMGAANSAVIPAKAGIHISAERAARWVPAFARTTTERVVTMRLHGSVTAALLSLVAVVTPAAAQDFYRGKEITLYVGSPAGGPYDAYARLFARHLGRNIPGNPGVVVQNMPGASGRRLMGFMYNLAPKDGTAIAAPQRAVAFDPLLGVDSLFDATKLTWLGSANQETNVCIIWHTSRIMSFANLLQREMVVGTGGPSSTDTIYPNLLNFLFGTRIKVVGGYKGAPETHIAMERGEVDGRCGISWDTLVSLNADWLAEKKVRLLVQLALSKEPNLPDVPWVFDLAKTEEERQILTFWMAPNKMGRPFLAPPGLPEERAALLRQGFAATLKDPDLLAEAARMNLAVAGIDGAQVAALIAQVYATPKAVVEKAALAAKGR
jgi:tripartite-type tricarboxylate transporter receptor subunit TctC